MEIDERLVRDLVKAQFPQWADLPVTPVERSGWDNRTFRLGERLSVRLPTGDWYALQVAKEQRWLPVLARQLAVPIPTPVARGEPAEGYPYPWSVYRWLEGRSANLEPIADLTRFATDVARFLNALREVDPTGGPEPGPHNFFRGGPVGHYAQETYDAVEALGEEIPRAEVLRTYEAALAAPHSGPPVWFHGDIAVGNLLVRQGQLSAVIDFGTSGVGDPACDLALAWTLLDGPSRDAFRGTLGLDAATWARARGWALWKALITLVQALDQDESAAQPRRDIARVLADS